MVVQKGYRINPETFFYFYASKNWMVGKNKMKQWKMALAGWASRDVMDKKVKLYPIKGKTCGKRGCRMPAVHKDISGGYTNYTCGEHMPDKVKEKYVG